MAREPGARSAGYGDPDRRGGPWKWLVPLLGLLLLALLLLLLLRGCSMGDDNQNATTTPTATTAQPDTTGQGGDNQGASGSGGSTAAAGQLTSGGQPVPLLGSLAQYAGKPVQGRSVQVESVVGNEAFWVGESKANRVLVHLARTTESPFKVRDGQPVTLTGKVVRLDEGDAERFGVRGTEGVDQVTKQGHYIEATQLQDR